MLVLSSLAIRIVDQGACLCSFPRLSAGCARQVKRPSFSPPNSPHPVSRFVWILFWSIITTDETTGLTARRILPPPDLPCNFGAVVLPVSVLVLVLVLVSRQPHFNSQTLGFGERLPSFYRTTIISLLLSTGLTVSLLCATAR